MPIEDIVAQIDSGEIKRVPGTAVFVARITREIPPLVVWHLRHTHALHDSVGILNVVTEMIPYVAEKDRLQVRQIAPQVWRNQAHYGFMEQPDLPALLERARAEGYPVAQRGDLLHRARDGRQAQGWQGAAVAGRGRVLVHAAQFERDDRLLPPAEG